VAARTLAIGDLTNVLGVALDNQSDWTRNATNVAGRGDERAAHRAGQMAN
jgi:hypothetical protein